jgi:hypothetical protein
MVCVAANSAGNSGDSAQCRNLMERDVVFVVCTRSDSAYVVDVVGSASVVSGGGQTPSWIG